jgi:Na+/H+-dicarboxylate symporter
MSAAGDLAGMVVPGAEPNANFLTKILKELVPPSLIEPFLDNDVSQLLILGILFGLALRQADTNKLRKGFEEFNKLLIKALDIVLKFTPVIVFCSISLQVLDLGLEAVSNMAWLAVCITVCEITVMIAYCAAVRIISGMSVKRFTSSAFPAMITSASIMSSKAAIPTNMAACKKLGVPSNIYNISVPMSAIFNKQGDYVPCVVSALFLALMCGIEVTAWNVFLLAIQAIIIVIASSQMTAILVIPESLGVPSAAVQLILGITALMDIAGVALDSLGASASSVMIAGRENLRDERL